MQICVLEPMPLQKNLKTISRLGAKFLSDDTSKVVEAEKCILDADGCH